MHILAPSRKPLVEHIFVIFFGIYFLSNLEPTWPQLGLKMEPSWTPNGLLLGLPLENAVSLGNTTIPTLKIRFCCILGMFFDTFLNKVGPFVRLSIRCPFGRPFFRFHGHLGSQLEPKRRSSTAWRRQVALGGRQAKNFLSLYTSAKSFWRVCKFLDLRQFGMIRGLYGVALDR